MECEIGRVENQSYCGTPIKNTVFRDLVFDDDAVIFVELLEILIMALEELYEETMPLEPQVSWPKTQGIVCSCMWQIH